MQTEECAVIWDVDGTLVDTAEMHFHAWLRLAKEMGRPFSRHDFALTFGRRWLRVQRKRIAVTDGAFASTVRPPVPGRYRLSVTGGGVTRRRRIVAT